MPQTSLDPVIHAPLRLQVCALLAAAESLDFAAVRARLDISESVLSKHLKILAAAGYVEIRKATSDARQRTWLALTPAGHTAFAAHVAALSALLRTATGQEFPSQGIFSLARGNSTREISYLLT